MRKLALLGFLAGCTLYAPGGGDDVCHGGVLISSSTVRDPSTGTCESVPNAVECGCGELCDPPSIPDWGACNTACDSLDEATCLTTSACRAAYTEASGTAASGTMTAFQFRGCWATARSGPVEGGDCTLLDAQACSRHDDCGAIYIDHLDAANRVASTTFGRCIAEPNCGHLTCGPDQHCQEECPACDGLSTCVPNATCESLATEPDCKIRHDCVPIYAGTDCTCTPTECTCAVETYERCETAPAP